MLSGQWYLLCTCTTELELAILDAMSVEREFLSRIRITILFWREKLSFHHYPLSSAHDFDFPDVG
jgi:hypothetical protein